MISTLFAKFNDMLLTTASVIVNANGRSYSARVLLDGGSQCNFVTSTFCDKLKLQMQPEVVDISGIGKSSHKINQSVQMTLLSHVGRYAVDVSCLVMKDITEKMPQESFDIAKWNIPHLVKLADPKFNKPGNIDILLSASVFFNVLLEGIINLGEQKPKLFNSQLGWLAAGGGHPIKSSMETKPKVFPAITKQSLSNQITVRMPFKSDTSLLQHDNRTRADSPIKKLKVFFFFRSLERTCFVKSHY